MAQRVSELFDEYKNDVTHISWLSQSPDTES